MYSHNNTQNEIHVYVNTITRMHINYGSVPIFSLVVRFLLYKSPPSDIRLIARSPNSTVFAASRGVCY